MDKPLYTFPVIKQGLDTWLIASAILTVLTVFALLYFKKNTRLDYNRRNIIVMLLGFMLFLAGGTMLFRLFSLWRLKPVVLYNNRIVTPYGAAPLSNIKDFYIKLETRYKPMQTNAVQDSARYFFLIERNDKTHVLSEGDYPIYDILDKMNEAMGYDEKKE